MDDIKRNVIENGGPLYIGQSQYICLVLYYLHAQVRYDQKDNRQVSP